MKTIMHRFMCLFVAIAGIVCAFAAQAAYDFTTVDYPGADNTDFRDINNSGQIVGNAFFADGSVVSFTYDSKKKTFTTLAPVPGSIVTFLLGINESGEIVGGVDDGTQESGAILDKKGSYTIFQHPGFDGAEARGVGPSGLVTGFAFGAAGTTGFIYDPRSNHFTDFLPTPVGLVTIPRGINGRGQVVGSADVPGGPAGDATYGFLRDPGGAITLFLVNDQATAGRGITDAGLIAGFIVTEDGGVSGFVGSLSGSSSFQSLTIPASGLLNVPGAVATIAQGINNAGVVAGYWFDADGFQHAYFATPSKGK